MKNTGILLLHGFAGNPEEVKPLRDFLTEQGYFVECPLLPGHGETKKELSETTHDDWVASAERAYLELSKECENVVAVGFSMGGLLAANLISDFSRYGRKYLDASADKSLSSLIEFLRLLTKTKPMFGNITCKTLVIQALDDDTVHYKSAGYILKKIRTEKTACMFPKGGHMILEGENGPEVCKAIDRFIRAC